MVRNRRRSNIPHLTPETTQDPSAQIHAPFDRLEEAELERKVDQFILETGLSLYHRHFRKGAFIAQNDSAFDGPRDDRLSLLEEESSSLQDEKRRRWKHPRTLWALVIVCAIGAATQGWDESAIDGAQIFYIDAFGITGNQILIGFVASAPYLCSVFSCWLTQPLNKLLGRRGTIFFSCVFSIASCLGQAFSYNWKMMVALRFLLGIGFGPKSATIPIWSSECAPADVRGSLVMFWQFFTAFGIMLGYICGAIFRGVLDGTKDLSCMQPHIPPPVVPMPRAPEVQRKLLSIRCSLNWRIMVAAPMIPPIILAMCVIGLVLIYFFVPETKGVELEDLDKIFEISTRDFAREQRDWAVYFIKRYVFRRKKSAPPSAPTPRPTELTPYQH